MPLAVRPSHLIACALASLCLTPLPAQTPIPPDIPALAATRAEATSTRDAFIARVKAAGFTCPLPAPQILVEDVPSFGQYDDEKNVLRTSDWTVLNPEERAAFLQFAGPSGSEADARAIFELAAHQWILIHELGHWWQNCTKAINYKNPWKMELTLTASLSPSGVRPIPPSSPTSSRSFTRSSTQCQTPLHPASR